MEVGPWIFKLPATGSCSTLSRLSLVRCTRRAGEIHTAGDPERSYYRIIHRQIPIAVTSSTTNPLKFQPVCANPF